MEIQEYFNGLKEFYTALLSYIDGDDEMEANKQRFIEYFKNEKISEDRDKLNQILRLLIKISSNHARYPNYIDRIKDVLFLLEPNIKQTYSNSEIFEIFKFDRFLLLQLIERKTFAFDQSIVEKMIKYNSNLVCYFYPEIESFLTNEQKKTFQMSQDILTDFQEKRKNGENDSYLSSLIRNDSVEEFISYVNRTNLRISSQFKSSLFETNSFLLNRNATLIEYAAFFGSIQIFQYLLMNKVDLNPSLWIFTIHSKNPQFIHILEENNVQMINDSSIEKCLEEAIKCHHNDIARYLKQKMEEETDFQNKYEEFLTNLAFNYVNFDFLPENLDESYTICYVKYCYNYVVKIMLNQKKLDINQFIKI